MIRWRLKTRRGKVELGETYAVWSRFRQYARPYRWHLVGALAATMGAVATQIAAPWPIKIIFDYILADSTAESVAWIESLRSAVPAPMSLLVVVCAAILVIAVLDAVLAHARDVLLAVTGQRVVGRVRQALFAHLQSLAPDTFHRRPAGDLLMRLTGDIQMLRQMLVGAMVTAVQSAATIAAMLAMMIWLNPVLTLLSVATAPLLVFASYRITRQIRRAAKGQREKESEVAGIAHDVLGAMDIVQAFNREPVEQKRFARQNRSSVRAGVKTTRLESRLYRLVSLTSAAAMCLILFVGVRAVLGGSMTPGDLLVFVAYLRTLNKPVRNLAKLSGQVAKATSCGQRVAEILTIEPTVVDAPQARPLTRVKGEIDFECVTFAYDDGTIALADVSLHVAAGERVAIVGHTGAGKSTLFRLLLRFADPQKGTVSLDAMDLREVTTASLRGHIGWVHQDTVLFGMTVADNIALGAVEADRERVVAAARRVQVDEFALRLPDGYDTVLGERGATLSGGQRQRIALARALLRQSPLLLLDEPATGLDAPTRHTVEQAWMSSANRATTLVICHRLQGMDRFDRVVVLHRGRVAATGTHEELLQSSDVYAALTQAGGGAWRLPASTAVTEKVVC